MDKKNTLLLTVIAVATLLVAVVGATFAFFTAQNNGKAETPVNVKTETTDSLLFGSFDPLYIIANQQNFADVNGENEDEHVGSQKAVSTGKIEFKRGANSDQKYCYTAKLTVTSNNFVYAPDNTDFKSDSDGRNAEFKRNHAPELMLKITKVTQTNGSGDVTVNYTKALGTDCTSTEDLEGQVKDTCVYYGHLSTQRKVCTQDNSSYKDSEQGIDDIEEIQYTDNCQDNVSLEGYDITVLGNTSDNNLSISEISFPTEDGGSDLKHQLNASTEKDTVTDTWTAELVFVNYNWDQQYNASTAENAKKFVATWQFAETPCEGE